MNWLIRLIIATIMGIGIFTFVFGLPLAIFLGLPGVYLGVILGIIISYAWISNKEEEEEQEKEDKELIREYLKKQKEE